MTKLKEYSFVPSCLCGLIKKVVDKFKEMMYYKKVCMSWQEVNKMNLEGLLPYCRDNRRIKDGTSSSGD